jgi:hypothetical protein
MRRIWDPVDLEEARAKAKAQWQAWDEQRKLQAQLQEDKWQWHKEEKQWEREQERQWEENDPVRACEELRNKANIWQFTDEYKTGEQEYEYEYE